MQIQLIGLSLYKTLVNILISLIQQITNGGQERSFIITITLRTAARDIKIPLYNSEEFEDTKGIIRIRISKF